MKRLIMLALAGMIAVLISACGEDASKAPAMDTAEPTAVEAPAVTTEEPAKTEESAPVEKTAEVAPVEKIVESAPAPAPAP